MAGVSVPTITRAIKDRRLSATPKKPNGYEIDVAELERVFTLVTPDPNMKPQTLELETPNALGVLEREIELLREAMRDKDTTIDDLRTRLDREGEERRAIQARLTDMTAPAQNEASGERVGFRWPWGRKAG